jgi:ribosome recycling factor
MLTQNILGETDNLMNKTIDRLHTDFSMVRTGRASPALLDAVKVEYYGSMVPLSQVGNIAVTEARVIEVRPWDISTLHAIEKAVVAANLGITPNNDGKIIRLVFPTLNEDRRKELVKVVKKLAEEFRVSLRNIRRDSLEKIKQAEKAKEMSQDLLKQNEEKIQVLTNNHIKKVDEILAAKEKEILEI